MGTITFIAVCLCIMISMVFVYVWVGNRLNRMGEQIDSLITDAFKNGSYEALLNDLACESVNGGLQGKEELLLVYMSKRNRERFMKYRDEYMEMLKKHGYEPKSKCYDDTEKNKEINTGTFFDDYPKKN